MKRHRRRTSSALRFPERRPSWRVRPGTARQPIPQSAGPVPRLSPRRPGFRRPSVAQMPPASPSPNRLRSPRRDRPDRASAPSATAGRCARRARIAIPAEGERRTRRSRHGPPCSSPLQRGQAPRRRALNPGDRLRQPRDRRDARARGNQRRENRLVDRLNPVQRDRERRFAVQLGRCPRHRRTPMPRGARAAWPTVPAALSSRSPAAPPPR